MTATITPERIQVTNGGDEVTFDTDDRLFFSTDFLTGSLNIPERTSASYQTYTHVIDDCHSSADKVVGVVNLDVSGLSVDAGIPGFGWFNAGGTYLHFLDGRSGTRFHQHGNVARMSTYTFFCEGGELKCYETTNLANVDSFSGNVVFTQRAFTLHYRIWCGTFDQ